MTNSQKLENILNLSLDVSEDIRAASVNLETGYDPAGNLWELIIKFSGDFNPIAELALTYSLLLNGFAVIVIDEILIETLAALPEVEYIEKPKRLFFTLDTGRRAACVSDLQLTYDGLYGEGVMIAVIDSGIDIFNNDFRNEDGSTRISYLWDQSVGGNPPSGYFIGSEFDSSQLNEMLMTPSFSLQTPVPGEDISGHGTAVAGVAAGNGSNSFGLYAGVAPKASLLIVKLAPQLSESFPRTTQLMQGVDYAIRKGLSLRMPVVINLSFGNNYGPHDGTFLVEQYLNGVSDYWKNVIVAGAGNEGASRTHSQINVTENITRSVRLAVGNFVPSLNVQIWKEYVDIIMISVISPSGLEYIIPVLQPDTHQIILDTTLLLIYVGEPSPFSTDQEIYVEFIPGNTYIDPGEWQFVFTGADITSGTVDLWLPGTDIIGDTTGFFEPDEELTITIPSTAEKVISVGAYDSRAMSYAPFSGRGSERLQKPDISAPGVGIIAPAPNNSYSAVSGTSIAAPFVSGGAALLMEWGIVRGNDPYLYGEKVKAYLRKGARKIFPAVYYPDPRFGWGALCVRNSFPPQIL